jgi:hypothetical protein
MIKNCTAASVNPPWQTAFLEVRLAESRVQRDSGLSRPTIRHNAACSGHSVLSSRFLDECADLCVVSPRSAPFPGHFPTELEGVLAIIMQAQVFSAPAGGRQIDCLPTRAESYPVNECLP